MGTKKQWTGREKLVIVLQGLKGDCAVSARCATNTATQGRYCKWGDQLLTDGAKLFERDGVDHARNAWNAKTGDSKKRLGNDHRTKK